VINCEYSYVGLLFKIVYLLIILIKINVLISHELLFTSTIRASTLWSWGGGGGRTDCNVGGASCRVQGGLIFKQKFSIHVFVIV
jgi:hypothetical protein